MAHKNNGLAEILVDVIDGALQSLLGDSGKEAVYFYLRNQCGIRKEDIPSSPEVFIDFLNMLFGSGSRA